MTSTTWTTPLLAAALALSGAPAAHARAQTAARRDLAPASAPTRVRLEIDVSGLAHADYDVSAHAQMTEIAMTKGLREAGFEVAAPDASSADPRVVFSLAWLDFDGYVFELAASVTGPEGAPRVLPTRECDDCTDDELVAMMGVQLDEAVAVLREPAPVEAPEPIGGVTPVVDNAHAEPPEANPQAGPEEPPPPPTSPLVAAGVGVSLLGVGGLVGGGLLLGRDAREDGMSDGFSGADRTSYGTPGVVTLVAGGVLLAGGVAMIILGERHKAKARASHSGPGAAAGRRRITWTPTFTGLAGKF